MVKSKKLRNEGEASINLKPKEKIIKSLIENKNPQSIMTLSGATILDYKNTYNIVDELAGIVSKEKIGNTNLIKINLVPNQEIYNVENNKTQ